MEPNESKLTEITSLSGELNDLLYQHSSSDEGLSSGSEMEEERQFEDHKKPSYLRQKRLSMDAKEPQYMETDSCGAIARAKAMVEGPITLTNKRSSSARKGGMVQQQNLLALGTKKRDRRSIEEIQRDIRRRRADTMESIENHNGGISGGGKSNSTSSSASSSNCTSPPTKQQSSKKVTVPTTSLPSARLQTIANKKSVHGRLANKILGRSNIKSSNNNKTKSSKSETEMIGSPIVTKRKTGGKSGIKKEFEETILLIEPSLKRLRTYESSTQSINTIVTLVLKDLLEIGDGIEKFEKIHGKEESRKLWEYSSQFTKINGVAMQQLYLQLCALKPMHS